MKVQSLILDQGVLTPVEVELTLWPGLPSLQFLGRADQHLKESALRIKSAIRASGFDYPKASQILVNLRPSHIKKTSRGLELAVAAAYLWETEQVKKPIFDKDFFVYGELSLSGEVFEPDDLDASLFHDHAVVMTGRKINPSASWVRKQVIQKLDELETPENILPSAKWEIQRPREWQDFSFSIEQAELLKVLAVGEHHALLAGPAGSGKTTVAKALPDFLRHPHPQELRDRRKWFGENSNQKIWRPFVKPHHTTPPMAMIGGGSSPYPGEISRSHGGVLVLDELLEFSPVVQEALREPMEEGIIRVSRMGKNQDYPARTQVIATTNLCPCGKWTPKMTRSSNCNFTIQRCQSYLAKLSGPLADRFDFLYFTERRAGRETLSGQEILAAIEKATAFQGSRGCAREQAPADLFLQLEPFMRKVFDDTLWESERRRTATLRLARTFADLECVPVISRDHVNRALEWTQKNFLKLAFR